MSASGDAFSKFTDIIAKLRDPVSGCPWDLKQDHKSLRPYVIEEDHEVVEAIDAGDDGELCSELGDLLLQVVLHAQLAKERGAFSIADVAERAADKMIRRHPHVFADVHVSSADEVVQNWEHIKLRERREKSSEDNPKQGGAKGSALSGVPVSMPALIHAQRIGEKAAKVSFDWPSIEGVWTKVEEEIGELKVELSPEVMADARPHELCSGDAKRRGRIEHELGDVLFSFCQLARWLNLDAESSLRASCRKFAERFRTMEHMSDRALEELSEDEMEHLWEQAKEK